MHSGEKSSWISVATGLEMRKSKMKCQIDPPMNCGAKQIGKSPVWQFLFNGAMHKSSFAIQGIWRDTWKCTVEKRKCKQCTVEKSQTNPGFYLMGRCINHPLPFKVFADFPWVAISLFPQPGSISGQFEKVNWTQSLESRYIYMDV